MKPKFATAINCMDGRAQVPVTEFIKKACNVEYVDMITLPGPDKVLSKCKDARQIEAVKSRVAISYECHGSKSIFIAGHHDCAGNPVDKKEHLSQIKKAVEIIGKWGFAARVSGLWIDEKFQVEEI